MGAINVSQLAHIDGNCTTCNEEKPLDMMVRKNYLKNLYECIDCKVEDEIKRHDDFEKYRGVVDSVLRNEHVETSKLKALIKWCFG